MGLFDILSSAAEALADQGKREKERRERRQHRSNRVIVDMYNDAIDGGSNYRKTARESINGYNGWYTCPHCNRSKENRTDDTGRDFERRRKELRDRNKRDTDFLDEISRGSNQG